MKRMNRTSRKQARRVMALATIEKRLSNEPLLTDKDRARLNSERETLINRGAAAS